MASISKEQILKINNSCSNDWRLDTQYYLLHGEKRLVKHIELDKDGDYLEFALYYNYENQITLHISKYNHEKGTNYASTQGMGKKKTLEETRFKRKTTNNLIYYTQKLDNDILMEINKATPVASGYGMIVESEEF